MRLFGFSPPAGDFQLVTGPAYEQAPCWVADRLYQSGGDSANSGKCIGLVRKKLLSSDV
jgi:hypothetical protein